jgi:secondary thiamine-phosphate synthase enzyme
MLLQFRTTAPKQCLEITERVRAAVRESGVEHGLCHVAVLHATAAIVVNENDDRAIPDHAGWLHDRVDDNAQAHIKAAILGPSETIPIRDGDLLLGTWQGVILVELDGPRAERRVAVTVVAGP